MHAGPSGLHSLPFKEVVRTKIDAAITGKYGDVYLDHAAAAAPAAAHVPVPPPRQRHEAALHYGEWAAAADAGPPLSTRGEDAKHAHLLQQTRDMVISLQRELFEGADVDGDGKVTRAEFEAWHRQRTGEAPDAEEVAVFEGMDADHDGAARTTPCVL